MYFFNAGLGLSKILIAVLVILQFFDHKQELENLFPTKEIDGRRIKGVKDDILKKCCELD